jgi:hypothetical protein
VFVGENTNKGGNYKGNFMNPQSMNLNIRYDAPDEVWSKVQEMYSQLEGWMGDGHDLPYWFGFNQNQKHICASVEPSGLQFTGLMDDKEWEQWAAQVKELASKVLGYKVREIEDDELD